MSRLLVCVFFLLASLTFIGATTVTAANSGTGKSLKQTAGDNDGLAAILKTAFKKNPNDTKLTPSKKKAASSLKKSKARKHASFLKKSGKKSSALKKAGKKKASLKRKGLKRSTKGVKTAKRTSR